ncbi:MAG: NAD-dependent epimerase/dehydratase family protein [Planctomycetota bacterium]|nr:NAD-dependent epimerase/dehydratase family protein [Planctomycetota bacterium]
MVQVHCETPKVLISGGAGFIGSHVVDRFLREGWFVRAVDNFDDYYDSTLKSQNIAHHIGDAHFELARVDIRNYEALRARCFDRYDLIVHLAARPGVRPSIEHPAVYYETNVRGTLNVLRLARECVVPQVVFASSSSVYGRNPHLPWKEDGTDPQPISPYAATKVTCEILGEQYARRYGIRFIALRLFTIYGPRQRPDLCIHKFALRMLRGQPITLYGDGSSTRDYTYVQDAVEGIWAAKDYAQSNFEIINIGTGNPVSLNRVVLLLEEALHVRADSRWEGEQRGDLRHTRADCTKALDLLGYKSLVPFSEGILGFADWMRQSRQEYADFFVPTPWGKVILTAVDAAGSGNTG